MTVVVHDEDAARLAAHVEAPFRALELVQPRRHALERNAEFQPHGDGGQRVQQVVMPGDVQFKGTQRGERLRRIGRTAGAAPHCGADAHRSEDDVGRGHIRSVGHAVGHHPPGHPPGHSGEVGIVRTADDGAEEGHLVGEIDERLPEVVEAAVVFQVLVVDVRNHRHCGKQFQERPIALVGLRHHQLAASEPCVAAERTEPAANHRRRVEPGPLQRQRDHRRRRSLAVRTSHRDRVAQAHQLGQHLCPRNHRDVATGRLDHFRIRWLHRRRDHHDISTTDVLCGMADVHSDAERGQSVGDGRSLLVRAGHHVLEVRQQFGDAAHAAAANADEMDTARPP